MSTKLNPQQEEVAAHVHGRILTLAGPGSGKTRTLTERTGRLIRGGVNPANILCLTFTNKARDEMRVRIAAVHGAAAGRVFISNFHGLCGLVLRKMGAPLGYSGRMTVIDADDQVDLLMQIARKRGLEPTKPAARMMAMVANDWRESLGSEEDLLSHVPGKIDDDEVEVIRRYVQTLRERDQADFSGLLSETVRLLREQHDARQRLVSRFRFIQVDEYQDTNRAQNEIVELLAGDEDNVLAVGDQDQSIYEWRGASPDGIAQFIRNGEKKTGRCSVVKLGINYRSTPQIVEVADRLIRHCAGRIAVEFSTVHAAGEPVKCLKCKMPEEEAAAVASSIHTMVQAGTMPREVAVFYRTNDMSRLVEQELAKRKVPYMVVGGGSYYDRMEVKDVLSMLRFVCNPRDGISFARVANKPARGLGDALVGRLEAHAERERVDLLTAMRLAGEVRDENGKPLSDAALTACRGAAEVFGLPTEGKTVAQVAHELVERTRYDEWLKEKYEAREQYEERRRNVHELLNAIADFGRTNPGAGIADYLQSIALYTEAEAVRDDNAVRLMSLHASKGLEFDVVYMIGVEHGILPHDKAVKDRGERGLEEERRLCYVGFTRARKVLRVTWCGQRQDVYSRDKSAKFRPSLPSRLLLEAGLLSDEEYQRVVDEARVRAPQRRPATGMMRP